VDLRSFREDVRARGHRAEHGDQGIGSKETGQRAGAHWPVRVYDLVLRSIL
jgi:hypothetical protein